MRSLFAAAPSYSSFLLADASSIVRGPSLKSASKELQCSWRSPVSTKKSERASAMFNGYFDTS